MTCEPNKCYCCKEEFFPPDPCACLRGECSNETLWGVHDPKRHMERYIGDGAYVYLDDCANVVLYTSDGVTETDRVVIDVGHVAMLNRWLSEMHEYVAEIRKQQALQGGS